MGVKAGIPDLMLIWRGKVYGLEIKTRTGRSSREQDAMLAAIIAAGGHAAIAYGLDAALDQLAAWGLLGRH